MAMPEQKNESTSTPYNWKRAVRNGILTGLVAGTAATHRDSLTRHIEDQLGRETQGHTQELGAEHFGKPVRSVNHQSRQVFVGSSLESRVQAAAAPLSVPEQAPQQIPLSGAAESLTIAGFGFFDTAAKRKKSLLALSTLAMLVSACGAGVSGTPIVTEAAPTTPVPQITETSVPYIPPTVGAETVTPPPDVGKITLPDYTNFSSVGFTKPVTLEALKNGPVPGLTKAAQEAFRSNAQDLLNRLPDADQKVATAAVCYRPDLERNAVIISRPGTSGMKEVFWLFRGTTPSFHPNFPSFQTTGDAPLTYKWVEVGTGDVVCKFEGEFPVVGTDVNAKDTVLSTIYAPASAKFVEAPVPTEVPLPSIDVTQAPGKWDLSAVPDAQRTQIERVVTDPAAAGQEARTAFDAFVIGQWQRMLKDAGVPNAEKLKDYALLDAIVEYTQKNNIHEVTLPLAIHRLILTDPSNLVPIGVKPGADPAKDTSLYGLEGYSSNMGTNERLREMSASNFKMINFYGEDIVRKEADPPFAMLRLGTGAAGDLVMVVNLPGIDPLKEQGAIMVLYDQTGKRHYFEFNIAYADVETSDHDLCSISKNNVNSVEACVPGQKQSQTYKLKDAMHFTGSHPLTKQELIEFLKKTGNIAHVIIRTSGGRIDSIWQNGVGTATEIAFNQPGE